MKLKMKLKHRDPRKRHDIEFRWLWSSGLTGATVVVTNTVARADRNDPVHWIGRYELYRDRRISAGIA